MSDPCKDCPEPEVTEIGPEPPKTSFNLYQCVHGHFFLVRSGKQFSDTATIESPNNECFRTQQLVFSEDVRDSFIESAGIETVFKTIIANFLNKSGKR